MKKKFNLLLVEDSEADQLNFRRIVKKLNNESQSSSMDITMAQSVEEAVDVLNRDTFDIVLLDLSLPDSDGLDGLQLFQDKFGRELPIIVLTGQKSESMALKAIQAGAQDYLQKGEITPFNLNRSIMYALERSKTANELDDLRVKQAKSLKMATLGEMAGGIAHEINNPLAIILGHADRIRRKCNDKINIDEFKESADKIEETTRRIAKIVKSLKAYSRKEDNDPLEAVRLIHIVEDALNLCSEKFKTTSVELIIGDILNVELLCQDIQLSQVLLNLLNNAHDAIQNCNKKWVRLFSQLDGDTLHLYVVDSGEILDETTKKKIFDPFYSTKPKGEGTGLGMSISKSIIEAHNGKIELVESERNTCFRISLPIISGKSQAA